MVVNSKQVKNKNIQIVIDTYKKILSLLEQKEIQEDFTNQILNILDVKNILDLFDVDDCGDFVLRNLAESLYQNKDIIESDISEEHQSLLKKVDEFFKCTSELIHSTSNICKLAEKIESRLPIYIYFELDKECFFYLDRKSEVKFNSRNHLQGLSNSLIIYKISRDHFFNIFLDASKKINNKSVKDKILTFCYLTNPDLLTTEERWSLFSAKVKEALKSFVDEWILYDDNRKFDVESQVLKMVYGDVPAIFLSKNVIKKYFLTRVKFLPSGLEELVQRLSFVPSSDRFKNQYIKEVFEELMDVDILFNSLKVTSNAKYIDEFDKYNFIKGFSDLQEEQKIKLRQEWFLKGNSYITNISELEKIFTAQELINIFDEILNAFLPGKTKEDFVDICNKFPFYNDIEIDHKISSRLKTGLRTLVESKFGGIEELSINFRDIKEISNLIDKNFDIVDDDFTSENKSSGLYLLFIIKRLGITPPKRLNILLDNRTASHFWIGKDIPPLPCFGTAQNLFQKIKEINNLIFFKNTEITFVDQTDDDLFCNKANTFKKFLGNIKILSNKTYQIASESLSSNFEDCIDIDCLSILVEDISDLKVD